MKKLLVITVVAIICSPANAHIGETPEECTTRYGSAVTSNKASQTMGFRKDGFIILCTFAEGVCTKIEFKHPLPMGALGTQATKRGKPIALTAPDLTRDEIAQLQAENGNGSAWKPGDRNGSWVTEDGARTAKRDGKKSLSIAVAAPTNEGQESLKIVGKVSQILADGLIISRSDGADPVFLGGLKDAHVKGDNLEVTGYEAGLKRYNDDQGASHTVLRYEINANVAWGAKAKDKMKEKLKGL